MEPRERSPSEGQSAATATAAATGAPQNGRVPVNLSQLIPPEWLPPPRDTSHDPPLAMNGVLKRCYCYLCARDVLAVEYAGHEVQCPFCSGNAVEILETQHLPLAPEEVEAFAPRPQDVRDPTRHTGVICDGCQERDFEGMRYRCLICPDFDLCQACYSQRTSIHPNHPFEAIRLPRQNFQANGVGIGDMNINPWSLGRAVVTVLEVNMDEDMDQAHSGLEEMEVAWWLAEDGRLADVKRVLEHDADWTCPICSEGVEAEDCNGWLVRICGGSAARPEATDASSQPTSPSSRNGDTGQEKDPLGHVYHESCLRRWLMTKNQCPVCRRSPVIPRPEANPPPFVT